jgi:acyl-coenzyme A thioesterase PaaI-like protein
MGDAAALVEEFPPGTAGTLMTDYPFVERAGLELVHVSRGRAVLRIPFEPNINHVGMVYAGALFTVAEVPGGVLFASAFDLSRFYPIVGEMKVRFAKPARTSVLVDARMADDEIDRVAAELEANGKAKWVLVQEVVDESGTVVATTEATYFGMSFSPPTS